MGCSKLTTITIPNKITTIGEWTFYDCSSLTSITIPNSVTSIGNYAFQGCSKLTTITIGSGVTTISMSSFSNCPELTDVYCYAEKVPSTSSNAFDGSYIEYATLIVPTKSIEAYKLTSPWNGFNTIKGIDGTTPEEPKTPMCDKPTISYNNGKLYFSSSTEDAEFIYEITDTDIKKGYTAEVDLNVTYNISVYATKAGYDNSETVTATLCWIDQQPKTEGLTNGVANVEAKAVLIKSTGGLLTIEGVDDGDTVNVYTIDGVKRGSAISQNGIVHIDTNLQQGNVAIVKIKNKSVKVIIK